MFLLFSLVAIFGTTVTLFPVTSEGHPVTEHAPLSEFLAGDLTLKREEALALIDSGLTPTHAEHRYVPGPADAEVYFPGLVAYIARTREQLATLNGSSLADPTVSPFIKMDAIAKALYFTDLMFSYGSIGLNRSQVEKWYTTVVDCAQTPTEERPDPQFTAEQLAHLHEALLKVAQVGSVFDQAWYGAFTSWSESNGKLNGLDKYTAMITELKEAFTEVVRLYSGAYCPQILGFHGEL